MTADEEDNYIVAQANEPLDEEGHFIHNNVSGRFREGDFLLPEETDRFNGRIPENGILCRYIHDPVLTER